MSLVGQRKQEVKSLQRSNRDHYFLIFSFSLSFRAITVLSFTALCPIWSRYACMYLRIILFHLAYSHVIIIIVMEF